MQDSIEEWREKAETENINKSTAVSGGKDGPENEKPKKFTVKIPENDLPKGPDDFSELHEGNIKSFTYDKEDDTKEIENTQEEDGPANDEKPAEEAEEDEGRLYDSACSVFKTRVYELVFGGILTAVLVYIDLAQQFKRQLPHIIDWSGNPLNYIVLNLVLLGACGIVFYAPAIGGISRLFKRTSNVKTLTSVAFFSAILYDFYLMAVPGPVSKGKFYMVSASAAICLFVNSLGCAFSAARIKKNLKFMMDKGRFTAAARLDDIEKTSVLTNGMGYSDSVICYPERNTELTDYMESASSRTGFDRIASVISPLVLIAALLCFAFAYLRSDISNAVIIFTIICIIGAPVTGELCSHLPMWRCCRSLRKKQTLLTGYDAVSDYCDVNAIVLDSKDMFPDGTVTLHGIKSFSGKKVDDAIIDATSLICAAGGMLSGAFMKIVYGKTELLREVQGYEYEDRKGMCGWVENRRVLIGNRALMAAHNIAIPPRSNEAKYVSEGWEVTYLAVSGELCAMFIIGYEARPNPMLKRLQKFGISLLVASNDPNITSIMIAEKFGFEGKNIKILSSKEYELLGRESSGRKTKAGLAFLGGADSFISAVTACIRLKGTIDVSSFLQIIGIVIGLLFMVYIAVLGNVAGVTPVQLMSFQAIWAVPVLLVSIFRRH